MSNAARPLRVAFFNAADRVSGAEALICQTVEGLISRGVEARLYAMRCETGASYVHQLPVFRGERRGEFKLRQLTGGNDIFFPSTLAFGRRSWIKDADIWHFHNFHGHYVSIPFLAIQSRRRPIVLSPVDQYLSTGYCCYTMGCERYRQACGSCPQITTMPYPGLRWDSTRGLLGMKKLAVRKSRFNILLHTDYLAQHYASTFVGSKPIDRIYYGVNTQVFRPMDRGACAEAFGLETSGRFVVGLFHSAIEEERKGFSPLLELLTTLGERMPGRIEVLVVGHASERARRYATPNLRVTALPFLKGNEELAMALNLCDVLLYPTQAENLSLTCLDALACGIPVISSTIGGQPEAVSDGVNGFLCEAGRYDQFIERVARLAGDSELVRQFSIEARERALRQFDVKTYIDNLIAYYDQVIQRNL